MTSSSKDTKFSNTLMVQDLHYLRKFDSGWGDNNAIVEELRDEGKQAIFLWEHAVA